MKEYHIAVKSKQNQVEDFDKSLQRFGLTKERKNKYSGVTTSKWKVRRIQNFSHSHHLTFLFDNENGSRSSDYRQNYFDAYPSQDGKYRCVYCGRKYPKEKITIDHLYPVNQVSQNLKLQEKMRQQGIPSLNSVENLVPACWNCNQKKSDKMGIWITRGKIGKSETGWKIRWILRILFFLGAITLIVLLCLHII